MEHANTTNLRQQHQQQQQFQQHHLEQQQQHNENQQQFCLRWHNHQTSLLSTLPVLLDQSHLTDVTISAEGRTLRAHRVVLSACSTFFMELFRTLEASNHPVIIIPGASFGAIVALLTFMYSGEVNVYEEQIPMLLNLAETLGIKGLADVQNNIHKSQKRSADYFDNLRKESEFERPLTSPTPPTPSSLMQQNAHTPTPSQTLLSSVSSPHVPPSSTFLTNKLASCTPLENLFLKSLQFYPNLLPQPLNFSQTALNKTTELLAKYQQQCNLYQDAFSKDILPLLEQDECPRNMHAEENDGSKRFCSREKNQQQQQQQQQTNQTNNNQIHQQKDIKRIDKIVENLRPKQTCDSPSPQHTSHTTTPTPTSTPATPQSMQQYTPPPSSLALKASPNYSAAAMTTQHLYTKSPLYTTTIPTLQAHSHHHLTAPYITPEDHAKLQQHMEQYAASNREAAISSAAAAAAAAAASSNANSLCTAKSEPNLLALNEKFNVSAAAAAAAGSGTTGTPVKPPSNSKLYATCFICHKQLSNQYNLRVHLETHQNVRYACNVCSHVSRSKDALRKHVSYRHPGAPSPCETDARRKRASKLGLHHQQATTTATNLESTSSVASPITSTSASSGGTSNFQTLTNDATVQHMSAQLNANPYLFLPNQFHLAAAAAAVAAAETAAGGGGTPACLVNTTPITSPTALDVIHNTQASSTSNTATTMPTELIKKEQNCSNDVNSTKLAAPSSETNEMSSSAALSSSVS